MKTAISMPDVIFERVTRTAKELGLSRSELLTRAATAYLDQLDDHNLTEEINRAVDLIGDTDDSNQVAAAAGRAFLRNLDDEW